MMDDPLAHAEEFDWQHWLEGLDLDQPVWELIDDPAWLERMTFSPDELAYLEARGREYAQELLERDLLPETPAMDMPDAPRAPEHGQSHDLDFDR